MVFGPDLTSLPTQRSCLSLNALTGIDGFWTHGNGQSGQGLVQFVLTPLRALMVFGLILLAPAIGQTIEES